MIVRPAKSLSGTLSLPGDKSISHRAVMFAALAQGESRIENSSTGEDCASTVRCLRQLGVRVEQEGTSLVVHGVGKHGLQQPSRALDCGNSGTTMRLLAGILAGQNFETVLTGDESLLRRPMNRIVEPLSQMGADIKSENGNPPLTIRPTGGLTEIEYKMPMASAQLKSCLLLAGLFAQGETTVEERTITRDHTERMLRGFGADLQVTDAAGVRTVMISSDSRLIAQRMRVPADISAAAFFLVAAVCLAGSDLTLNELGTNPTRTAILDLLSSNGASIVKGEETSLLGEPSANVRVRGSVAAFNSNPVRISGENVAQLIDEIPILAILGTQIEGGIEIRDAAELRVKETDRIRAVVENLRRMNADVEEFDDGFRVGRSELKGAEIDPFGDHRIAMAFAVAGLLGAGGTAVRDAECVDISFPGFFEILESVVKR